MMVFTKSNNNHDSVHQDDFLTRDTGKERKCLHVDPLPMTIKPSVVVFLTHSNFLQHDLIRSEGISAERSTPG
jgi:hypothetical protein